MSRTIYGAELNKTPDGKGAVNFDGGKVIGKNSEAFTAGDPVTIASGLLVVAGTTDTIYGIVQKTQTMASNNQTVDKVKPVVLVPDLGYQFLMGTNSDLAATNVGTYYKLTAATTGAVQVDVSAGAMTGTARVVECTAVDPFNEGGTGSGSGLRQGLFRFVKVTNAQD
jgi:hypothetical protein